MEITNQIISLYVGVGVVIIITCLIGWFTMLYFIANDYYKEKESNEKEKELKKMQRDNFLIDTITCEVREIVREELDKK